MVVVLEKKLLNLANRARLLTAKMFGDSGQGGHIGGSFSAAEILTVLYNGILKIDPKNPDWELRDHFVLSKGHISGMFASVLHLRGFFEEELLKSYDELESAFGMHTTTHIPGCEFSAGSLGHGLGFSVGLSLTKKVDKLGSRVFTLMGDGELDEGSVWEAAMSAGKFKLDNLTAIIDRNGCNMEGTTEESMPLESLEDKWKSFGWAVKTIDGHSISSLYETLSSVPFVPDKPSAVIAKTIKGKGLAKFAGDYRCHYVRQDAQKWVENYEELAKICEIS
jgi:transketolase